MCSDESTFFDTVYGDVVRFRLTTFFDADCGDVVRFRLAALSSSDCDDVVRFRLSAFFDAEEAISSQSKSLLEESVELEGNRVLFHA